MKVNNIAFLSLVLFVIISINTHAQERTPLDLTPQLLINGEYIPNSDLKLDNSCIQSIDFLRSFYKQLNYPASARDKGVSGTVVLSILVDEHGVHSNPQIAKDIGEECGSNALEVCKNTLNMCKTPVTLDGKAVRARIFLPINFKLH